MLAFKYPCGCIGLGAVPMLSQGTGELVYKGVPTLWHCDSAGGEGPYLRSRILRGPYQGEKPPQPASAEIVEGIEKHLRELYKAQRDVADIRQGFAALRDSS